MSKAKHSPFFRFTSFVLACIALSIAACSSTKPPTGVSTPPPTAATPPAPGSSAASSGTVTPAMKFRLTRASVTWLDNPSLPVLTSTGAKGTISSGDTIAALAALKVATPRELTTALKAKQVADGSNESITLMPIGGLLDTSGATTAVIVRAIVTQRATGAQWRVDLEVGNRTNAVVAKQTPARVAEQAAAFASTLVIVMQKSGLL